MARVPRQINFTKLVHAADRTKQKVKKNKVAAYQKWQKKIGKRASKLDRWDVLLRDALKKSEAAQKKREDEMKALADLMEIVTGAHKELKLYKEVPVKDSLPPPPKNITSLQSISVVIAAYILYLGAVKAYMAMANALSKETA
ncbi:MAG: hypothetical protein WAO69_10765 [Aestuariivita sp.]|uniref:hypothetical protein n=1 Tax=Aestuariivita sp. TaxID=1872407 RepID=UPI003BB145DB